eukprot:CAMPEP_0202819018 /NCGR_PEP_ID=MMETSP1389-20130828/8785_1 /ASSEMBLY_ACC=CAM_ASM_000865 /TAXON_ID=302021 /ORGANISM="Rhodomonas sp., Strain CCMP768" /LENGTH=207 /DNA_ID=CAMNT_0049491495 /DNA_START=9 /DNA_END=634 /DNA_ORIENTATION=-
MTKQMREALKPKYRYALIRVRFPDGFVIQGKFKPSELMGVVKEWVQSCLALPDRMFYLTTMPPVQRVTEGKLVSQSISELDLAPASLLNFGGLTASTSDPPPDLPTQSCCSSLQVWFPPLSDWQLLSLHLTGATGRRARHSPDDPGDLVERAETLTQSALPEMDKGKTWVDNVARVNAAGRQASATAGGGGGGGDKGPPKWMQQPRK